MACILRLNFSVLHKRTEDMTTKAALGLSSTWLVLLVVARRDPVMFSSPWTLIPKNCGGFVVTAVPIDEPQCADDATTRLPHVFDSS